MSRQAQLLGAHFKLAQFSFVVNQALLDGKPELTKGFFDIILELVFFLVQQDDTIQPPNFFRTQARKPPHQCTVTPVEEAGERTPELKDVELIVEMQALGSDGPTCFRDARWLWPVETVHTNRHVLQHHRCNSVIWPDRPYRHGTHPDLLSQLSGKLKQGGAPRR